MNEIYKPKYIEKEYDFPILIKICSTLEFLECFIQGKFYMNTNKYFSSLEQKMSLTNAQFDALEGVGTILNETEEYKLVINFEKEHPMIYQAHRSDNNYNGIPVINAYLNDENPCNIYCIYSIWVDLKNNKTTEVDSRIEELGEYCAVILNEKEFIKRVYKGMENSPYKFKSEPLCNFVNYIDIEKTEYIKLGKFRKTKDYEYQNEFRIALEIDGEVKPLKYFEVGNLSDIVLIGKTKYLSEIKVEDNTIQIGKTKINIIKE